MRKYYIEYTEDSGIGSKVIETDFDMDRFDLKDPHIKCFSVPCFICPIYAAEDRIALKCRIEFVKTITEIKE